jgi:flagellar biosynthesis protein FlhG
MTDQAAGLRRIAAPDPMGGPSQEVRVIAVTSGKGGVGKTTLAVNLGILLQRLGRRVMLFDADLGLANVDIVLGLTPRWNLAHVLRGEKRIEEILIEGPEGMQILPASSGVEEVTRLTSAQKIGLLEQIDGWTRPVDVMLVDTSAGVGDNVIHFNLSAHETVVVLTPEPTSITDAYALIKVLSQSHGQRRFRLILNQVRTAQEAKELFERFLKITDQFLDVSLDTLGFVTADRHMTRAVRRQRALIDLYPQSEAADCLRRIARRLDRTPAEGNGAAGGLGFFWRRVTMGSAQFPEAVGAAG